MLYIVVGCAPLFVNACRYSSLIVCYVWLLSFVFCCWRWWCCCRVCVFVFVVCVVCVVVVVVVVVAVCVVLVVSAVVIVVIGVVAVVDVGVVIGDVVVVV